MSLKLRISLFFTIAVLIAAGQVYAQILPPKVNDSLAKAPAPAPKSNSGLKSKVIYNARDSVRFDVDNQKMYLYGEGMVTYEKMQLKADYIEFDMARNIAFSRGKRDSAGNVVLDTLGQPIGDPVFSDGEKKFDAKEITYNMETKKGKIREVTTQEGEAYIHAKDAKKDTGEVYFIKNGRYTTCDLENPHFYLQATKIKIIPNDKIICGPAYLAVGDVPTPLVLPFGVFPNKKGRKSGVLIPSYGESATRGFFLKGGGYYFGLSDYFDLALRGDVYSLGSFGAGAHTNYNKRYGYTGSFGLDFAQIEPANNELNNLKPSKDFFIRWQHAQDPKANPTSRFSANVNGGSSTYQKYNANTANDYLSNTFSSNVAWNKNWPGRPYNLSVFATHSQNTTPKLRHDSVIGRSTLVDLTLPEMVFTRNRWYPLQRKNHIGKPNALEKIGINFTLKAKSQITTGDSLLFKPDTLKKYLRSGLNASIPVSTSQNFGPVIMSVSAVANGYGYFKSYRRRLEKTVLGKDSLITDTLKGFKQAYDYSTTLAFSTKVYGMFLYKHGRVKAIRHVITPVASFNYKPDFGEYQYRYSDSVLLKSTDVKKIWYSYFQGGVYGFPQQGKSAGFNFAINNNLEMKLRPSRRDTFGVDKKVILIDNFSISSFYNMAADSFRWSPVIVSARTRLFKVLDIRIDGSIDQYSYDTVKLHRRIERFQFDVNGQLGHLTSGAVTLSTSLRSLVKKKDDKKKPAAGKHLSSYDDELNYVKTHPDYYVDFNVPWDLTINYSLLYSRFILLHDTSKYTQSLSFSGNVSVTSKWKVGFHSGFDFVAKDFIYTSFDIYRDLHCWEMRLNWIPFGFLQRYMLTIAVKASVLQDLKLNKKMDWYDSH